MSGPGAKVRIDTLGDTAPAGQTDIAGVDATDAPLPANANPAALGERMGAAVGIDEGGGVIEGLEDDHSDTNRPPTIVTNTLRDAARIASEQGGRLTMDAREGTQHDGFVIKTGQMPGKGTVIGIVGEPTDSNENDEGTDLFIDDTSPQTGGFFAGLRELWRRLFGRIATLKEE